MITCRKRTTESIVYLGLWLIAVGLCLLNAMRRHAQLSEPLLNAADIASIALTLLPFLLLFFVNNNVLIPRLLLKNRLTPYFLSTAAAIVLIWVCQYLNFMHRVELMPPGMRPPVPHVRPLMPLPLFLDFTYALLVVGCNLAIALMFQHFDDKLERESLMKTNAENRLAYLKAQINPHFYLNMLNNIHGMIEINPEKAQGMIIDMSHLMRYTLYDSSKPLIPLADEVAFLRNYLRLMRQRFPESSVSITSRFPSDEEMRGISIPPLLFLVFIENAFKHGISYRDSSFVAVAIETEQKTIRFSCVNSNHARTGSDNDDRSGIGLRNINQRLKLLYGPETSPEITSTDNSYTVTLIIPIHAKPADPDN